MSAADKAARHAVAGAEDVGQRIDNFLFRTLKGVPKGHVYRLLRTGQVRVNGRRVKPTRRLEDGDDVRIPPVQQASAQPPVRGAQDLAWLKDCIIYEDDSLLVLNKPAGLAVHGGSGLSLGAIEALRALRPQAPYLELVHRLDRETSGCLLIAKRRSRLRAMHELLRSGEVEKKYLALLSGRLNDAGTVNVALRKHQVAGGERRVHVDETGKTAETHFKPLTIYEQGTLVEARISTGRTHQIRVHAAHLGHPVAGDDKYGEHETNREWRRLGLKRMFLHAASIGFTAPWNDVPLAFNAPLDSELRGVLDRMEEGGR
ncbi:MAG TPA: RluA family pseudouridine synthase [Gammaproteobacteria bacterium]|nr:RluA family pseudouridine synthase [Gammaproteobacteria bacterium]